MNDAHAGLAPEEMQFNNVPDVDVLVNVEDSTETHSPDAPPPVQSPETNNDHSSWFNITTMDHIRNYRLDDSSLLVGDGHITREPGRLHTIAGYGGVGKTRMAFNLALCGETGEPWMGYKIKNGFKTLIIQNENGDRRLQNDWEGRYEEVKDHVFFLNLKQGAAFYDPEFRKAIHDTIVSKGIGMVVIDPWTNFVGDTDHKNYSALIDDIFATLPDDPVQCPAVVVVAHCRKPSGSGNPKRGADLQHDILGSQVLVSRSRFVLITERADSTDLNDDRVLVTCAKASDALTQPRGCFRRGKITFTPVDDYDWDERDQPSKRGAKQIYSLSGVVELMPVGEDFTNGEWLSKAVAAFGMSESKFYTFQKEAVSMERVIKLDKRGDYRRVV